MATHKFFTTALFALLGFGMALTASAQTDEPEVTMDQAVQKAPQGHVRVMAIPSEANKVPMSTPVFTPSLKNPPGRNPGSKEKH